MRGSLEKSWGRAIGATIAGAAVNVACLALLYELHRTLSYPVHDLRGGIEFFHTPLWLRIAELPVLCAGLVAGAWLAGRFTSRAPAMCGAFSSIIGAFAIGTYLVAALVGLHQLWKMAAILIATCCAIAFAAVVAGHAASRNPRAAEEAESIRFSSLPDLGAIALMVLLTTTLVFPVAHSAQRRCSSLHGDHALDFIGERPWHSLREAVQRLREKGHDPRFVATAECRADSIEAALARCPLGFEVDVTVAPVASLCNFYSSAPEARRLWLSPLKVSRGRAREL
jgi:hypothetical protein